MVSIAGVAILLLAYSGLTTGQRKASRNVPVGADVKTSINFDCPEEFGYYPHPTDCTQYYVCVFGGALLESCTGGLMYSHELQTCDWPRNVGCDALAEQSPATATVNVSPSSGNRVQEARSRYTQAPQPPPPAQPAAVVTSRGQPRQLHHTQQEIAKQKQQQQLYADAEETLPLAEEVENDRQQRVYRGQPSTVGQVQRDRDGLRHSNAIPAYSGRAEKIGVISFGTQQQSLQPYSTITDILTNHLNDIKGKDRRKRQVGSHPTGPQVFTWHSPHPAQSKQNPKQVPHINSRITLFAGDSEEFQPFVPVQFKRNFLNKDALAANTHTHIVRETTTSPKAAFYRHFPYYNQHFSSSHQVSQTSKPDESNTHREYSSSEEVPKAEHENVDHEQERISSSTESYSATSLFKFIPSSSESTDYVETLSSQKETKEYQEESKENLEDDEDDYNSDNANIKDDEYLKPPPSFFESKNKYEDIPNPFADPNFDFDKFLDGLRESFERETKKPPTTTRKPNPKHKESESIGKNVYVPTNLPRPQQRIGNLETKLLATNPNTFPPPVVLPRTTQNTFLPTGTLKNYQANPTRVAASNPYTQQIYRDPLKAVPTSSNLPYVALPSTQLSPPYPSRSVLKPIQTYTEAIQTRLKPVETTFKPRPPQKLVETTYIPRTTFSVTQSTYSPQIPTTRKIQKTTLNPTTTFKPQKIITSTSSSSDEYYDDDESKEVEEKDSSQIKTSHTNKDIKKVVPSSTTLSSNDDEYYYEEYDYPETKNSSKSTSKNYDYDYERKKSNGKNEDKKPSKISSPSSHVADSSVLSAKKYHSPKLTATTSKYSPSTTFSSLQNGHQKPTKLTSTLPSIEGKHRQKPKTSEDTDADSTQNQSNRYNRVEESSAAPVQQSVSTATARTLYNSSRYEPNRYDPYYALYDDDPELYRDIDYHQNYNNNNAGHQQAAPQNSYRGTPAPVVQPASDPPKRGNSYVQNNYNNQDIYQQSTLPDYNEDNSYNNQADDQSDYRQSNNRQTSRGDRNELNYVEEPATPPKRIISTTTKKQTTTTTSSRPIPQKSTVPSRSPDTANAIQTRAQSIINTLSEDPGHIPSIKPTIPLLQDITTKLPVTYRPTTIKSSDVYPEFSLHVPIRATVSKPAPFSLPGAITTTEKTVSYHYITKPSRLLQAAEVAETTKKLNSEASTIKKIIIPTTYSPPKFFLKSILPKASSTLSDSPIFSFKPKTGDVHAVNRPPHKTIKTIRKLVNIAAINSELSTTTEGTNVTNKKHKLEPNYRHSTPVRTKVVSVNIINKDVFATTSRTDAFTTTTVPTTTVTRPTLATVSTSLPIDEDYISERISRYSTGEFRHYIAPNQTNIYPSKHTVEVPPANQLLYEPADLPKKEVDEPPTFKLKPILKLKQDPETKTVADAPRITTPPARLSRVNTAIKSLIAFGGSRRPNTNCTDNQTPNVKCNDLKQRTNTRGRGSSHYAVGSTSNESVNVNRGTPAPRSRPTLKPSTSIVSKASEFVDIYRFPPLRPDPIYPQPQPDKTAAKCRKDVCLLPDCSCGGKEIPGDIPVEQVPQMVLLTFDDSVNDLNKGLYSDLFEKGRVNPNGCPISATFYVSHEWTDYSQVQNLYSDGHEIASHTVSHSFGEQFSQKKWTREVAGQREILAAYGGVHLDDVRGMRAPFLSVGGNKMFKMLYDSNFTYDSSMPIYENKPPSWPYTLDYKLFHDCMIPPCPTRSYPGVWEVPMVMWQDLNGGRCSMGDACSNPADAEGVFKMLMKNFERHYTTNRAPFGLFYHAAWFTQPHHKEGFIQFLDTINAMKDVYLLTNWQALQWVRDPTPLNRLANFQPFQCNYADRPKRCHNPKVCNLWHKSGVRYMRTCQPCPDIYPWTGNTGIRSSKIDNDIED